MMSLLRGAPRHLQVARELVGRPYGHRLSAGQLDCSNLVKIVAEKVGLPITRLDPGSTGSTLARFIVEHLVADPDVGLQVGALALFAPLPSHARQDEFHIAFVDQRRCVYVLLHACKFCGEVTRVDRLGMNRELRFHNGAFPWRLERIVAWPD